MAANLSELSGGQLVVACLKAHQVEMAFSVAGESYLEILDALYDEFRDPNYAAMPLLRRLVTSGQLGRKAGRGFYDYAR